jgi:hypothetical protein
MDKVKVNKDKGYLVLIIGMFILLLLSMVNIKDIATRKEVLGIETQSQTSEKFWNDFLVNNPNYVQGWIEIADNEKAISLDPNYEGLIK